MTVAELRKQLTGMPKDAVVVLAVDVQASGNSGKDDCFTVDAFAKTVTLRPDRRVQIGDEDN